MKKNKFTVAVKDSKRGEIRPGKKLGQYRKLEFAEHDFQKLSEKEGLESWRVGIFFNGKLIS